MSEFSSLLKNRLTGLVELTPAQIALLESHYELLRRWNRRMNLTSVREPEQIVLRHYCESVLFGATLQPLGSSVVDIGTGPGFPGVPLAILHPGVEVTLVESNSRKCVFLRESTRGLPNVVIREARAAEVSDHFDWAVARAVAWKDLALLLPAIASRVGFLVSNPDAEEISKAIGFNWNSAVPVPWSRQRVMLFGGVSRGTS